VICLKLIRKQHAELL
jgi:hypothetical protein